MIVPGVAGEYGVTAGHSAIVSQMKAGVLQIIHTDSPEPEKYFVPGGEKERGAKAASVAAELPNVALYTISPHVALYTISPHVALYTISQPTLLVTSLLA